MRETYKKNNKFRVCVPETCSGSLVGKKLLVVSDLHLEPGATEFDQNLLDQITSTALGDDAAAVIIAGDMLDTPSVINDLATRRVLERFLKTLSAFCPVIIGVGNHDYTGWNPDRWVSYDEGNFKEYKAVLEEWGRFRKIFLLDNSSVEFEEVRGEPTGLRTSAGAEEIGIVDDVLVWFKHEICLSVTGLTLPPEYYGLSRTEPTLETRAGEHGSVLWETALSKTLRQITTQSWWDVNPENQGVKPPYKILLVHSPLHLSDTALSCIRELGYHLVIAGHEHNGSIPFWLDSLTGRVERGIIGAHYTFFPSRSRNTEFSSGHMLLTLGAMKMIPQYRASRALFRVTSKNFPPDIRMIEFF